MEGVGLSDRTHQIRISPLENRTFPLDVRIPLSTFVDCIGIPVISCFKWKRVVNRELCAVVLHPGLLEDKIELVINETYDKLLSYSSMLTRIKKAEKLFSWVKDYHFLSNFSEESNPINFWEKYKKLKHES